MSSCARSSRATSFRSIPRPLRPDAVAGAAVERAVGPTADGAVLVRLLRVHALPVGDREPARVRAARAEALRDVRRVLEPVARRDGLVLDARDVRRLVREHERGVREILEPVTVARPPAAVGEVVEARADLRREVDPAGVEVREAVGVDGAAALEGGGLAQHAFPVTARPAPDLELPRGERVRGSAIPWLKAADRARFVEPWKPAALPEQRGEARERAVGRLARMRLGSRHRWADVEVVQVEEAVEEDGVPFPVRARAADEARRRPQAGRRLSMNRARERPRAAGARALGAASNGREGDPVEVRAPADVAADPGQLGVGQRAAAAALVGCLGRASGADDERGGEDGDDLHVGRVPDVEGGGFGFPFGGDPEDLLRGLREFAEQQAETVQEAQREQFATLTLNTAVDLTSAALSQFQAQGSPEEQSAALRDAMRVLFPDAVALVSAARQGFMREHG